MAVKLKLADKRRLLVEHLIDVGWKPNVDYIETCKVKGEVFDLDALILGSYGGHNHLISATGKYTVRVDKGYALFFKLIEKSPADKRLRKLEKVSIGSLKLIENGVSFTREIITTQIILPEEEVNKL